MVRKMEEDFVHMQGLLNKVVRQSIDFYESLEERAAAIQPNEFHTAELPQQGIGTLSTLETFQNLYAQYLSGSTGSRYLGFVTGGSTPASVIGDWLVSVYDQNVMGTEDSVAGFIEMETIEMLKGLFQLSSEFSGTFVSGATMANFVGLALGRQWVAHQLGIDVSQKGLFALPKIHIASGAPHSSIYKALSMLGMGRESVDLISCLSERESIDVEMLRQFLEECKGEPCIVVANAGTVNTVDFDDIAAISQLKNDYPFWLHVDAAFGGFAACSPRYYHLVQGWNQADSITIDAHKWLNVPYDSAMLFTRHKNMQVEVFQNNAAYLGNSVENPEFVHLTPENSRRFRALPAWFTLMAYGQVGYQEIVERNVEIAQLLTNKLENSKFFRLVAPTRLNVVCFTLMTNELTSEIIKNFLEILKQDGRIFLTPTVYQGTPAIRAAFSNWRTQPKDIEIIWDALCETYKKL
jgi:glutamate/tyrosine decarboxylase-like PLP-dependent enzyme